MQGTGELTKVEGGAFALDGAGVGVDVQGRLAAAGIADLGSKGEMLFVGALDGFDQEVRLGFVDRLQDLAEAERLGIFVGLAGRTSGLASQTISWLTTARVPVTQTIRTKNQMGRASQLWTRNQSLERDFFDMRLTVG